MAVGEPGVLRPLGVAQGAAQGAPLLIGGNGDAHPPVLVAAGVKIMRRHDIIAVALAGAVGLFFFWNVLWRWALRGYQAAIVVLYGSYVLGVVGGPIPALLMAAFAFLPVMMAQMNEGPVGRELLPTVLMGFLVLVVLVVLGLIWVLALQNCRCRMFSRFSTNSWKWSTAQGRMASIRSISPRSTFSLRSSSSLSLSAFSSAS